MNRPYKDAADKHGRAIADRFFAGRARKQNPNQIEVHLSREELALFASCAWELGAQFAAKITLGADEEGS